MAEQGAEIIKVELPVHGDPGRALAPIKNRRAGFFAQQNRGKQSLSIDFRTDNGKEAIRRLLPSVDIVVENFTPGLMAKHGLGYDDLQTIKPDLIMLSISGFGQTGPLAKNPCFDFIAQAYSGLMHMTGEPDGAPLFAGIGLADSNAGVHGFAALGHALFNRARTGDGAHIDLSMVEALIHMQEFAVQAPGVSDGAFTPMRQGRHYQPVSPAGVFKGPKGWIVMIVTANQAQQLFEALGRPEMANDPKFKGNPARVENRDELTAIIEAWMATFSSDDEVVAALASHRVPCTKVMNPAELHEQPQLQSRGAIEEIEDPTIGPMTVPGSPFRFGENPSYSAATAPRLGQHNQKILAELGYSPEEIEAMMEAGVLFSKEHG